MSKSTDASCSSAVGTLTTNVMTVTKAYTVDYGIIDIDHAPPMLTPEDSRSQLFLVGNLCNHAHSDRGKYHGQATEVALMHALTSVGLSDQRNVSLLGVKFAVERI